MNLKSNMEIQNAETSSERQNKRITEYDILRVIVTLLVVLGHATYVSHVTDYGGCDYSMSFSDESLFYWVMSKFSSFIYLFHMPLFMMLSGAIFRHSFLKKKYSFKALLIEKGKRLMIPFFVVGILYAFPIKYLGSYYAQSDNLLYDFVVGQVMIRDDTHLWFLPTLFIIFIICYLIETYCPGHSRLKIGLMSAAFIINRLLGRHWQTPMEMTLWFYLGYQFEISKKLLGGVKLKSFLITCCILITTLTVKVIAHLKDLKLIEKLFIDPCLTIECSYIVYMISVLLVSTGIAEIKLFKVILRNSFGIYLYADPLNYVILAYGFNLFGSTIFTDMLPSMIIYIVRTIGTILVSITISNILRKCRIKYLC